MKQVQIPEELFSRLYAYFLLDRQDQEQVTAIKKGLELKMDAMLKRSEYKDFLTKRKQER